MPASRASRSPTDTSIGARTVKAIRWRRRRVGLNGCSQTRWLPEMTTGRTGIPSRRASRSAPGRKPISRPRTDPLRKDHQAFSAAYGVAGGAQEVPPNAEAAIVNKELARGPQVATQDWPARQLLARDEAQRERQVEQGHRIGQALVQRQHQVGSPAVNLRRAPHLQLQANSPHHDTRPAALDGMAHTGRSPATDGHHRPWREPEQRDLG